MFTSIARHQSLLLLKLLLCHPQRQVARERLTEIIWPGQSCSTMDGSLSVAKSLLNTGLEALCGQALLPRVHGDPPSYRVAGQSLLWTDVDACESAIRRAIATQNAEEALVQWETAYDLLQRGALLADDQAAYWYQARLVQDRRKKLAKQRVQCVLRIADLALEGGHPDRAVTVLNEEHEVNPANEEIAIQLMQILAQRGQRAEALQCYARVEAALLERDTEPRAETQALEQHLRSEGITRASVHRHVLFQQEEMGRSVSESADTLPTQDYEDTPIPTMGSESEAVNRRDFLRETGQVAIGALGAELLERFQRALEKPSTLDTRMLTYIERQTGESWQDRHGARLASSDLLGYVLDHFRKITELLEEPLLPTQRVQLYAIASKTALLIGELFIDMSHYSRARQFNEIAIKAAQEANDRALEVVARGRMSLAWTYSENIPAALTHVQEARHLAKGRADRTVCAWLAAIEAEAQANLHNHRACLKALDAAEHIEDQLCASRDSYLIYFDPALLRGYQGVCFRRLYDPEDKQNAVYLRKAQSVLIDSLTLLNPTLIQRQPTFLTDLAETYLQQGEIEEACKHASRAAVIASQIKLQKVLQRLYKIRQALEPFKDTQYIKDLDGHLVPLIAATSS